MLLTVDNKTREWNIMDEDGHISLVHLQNVVRNNVSMAFQWWCLLKTKLNELYKILTV
jgi:hypothetical protein